MDMSNNYIFLSRFLESFVLLFILLIYNNKKCLSLYRETTIYCTAMCDKSKEREFNYLFYGISQVQIG